MIVYFRKTLNERHDRFEQNHETLGWFDDPRFLWLSATIG